MAGIYIHVPFCKKKCLYCDFYSIGSSKMNVHYPASIEKELALRKSFIAREPIDTIYFGGGTPSLLLPSQVSDILKSVSKFFDLSSKAEITLEANPDDISKELLQGYRSSGINRLSLGIQSFIDRDLHFLGRRHSALSAEKAIILALQNGFYNISVDLIYGIPNSTVKDWENNLKKVFSLDIKHLSCYHLTYEKGTPLTRKLIENKIQEIDESISVQQFNLLRELAEKNDFIHYEVSNLAKDGFYSRHNTAYWNGEQYLGLGPAAHSFNGFKREWNPSSFTDWETGIEQEKPSTQSEFIDKQSQFNEILLTHLRTKWGVDLSALKKFFDDRTIEHLLKSAEPFLKTKRMDIKDNHLLIPPEYFFISDGIIGNLILLEE